MPPDHQRHLDSTPPRSKTSKPHTSKPQTSKPDPLSLAYPLVLPRSRNVLQLFYTHALALHILEDSEPLLRWAMHGLQAGVDAILEVSGY